MNQTILSQLKDKIYKLVKTRRLREAFSEALSLSETMMSFETSETLQRAEETYRQMLRYAASGAADPERQEMIARLGETILTVTDILERQNQMADSASLYYSTARFEKMRPAETVAAMLDDYRCHSASGSVFNFVAGSQKQEEYRANKQHTEELERRIFNRVWCSHPLDRADAEALHAMFASDSYPRHLRILVVWALTLGALQFYDSRRLELLCDARMTADPQLQGAALVSLLLALGHARGRYIPRRVRNRLDALADTSDWNADIELTYKELTRTRDTDRITAKIRDEVVPEMMKLRPEISKRFNNLPTDPEELEENPEWTELLEKSGVADKLKEMSEIQEEGGDVMMGTFAHLKVFPFFHVVANWFLPFHTERSEFAGAENEDLQAITDIVAAMPMLCDSDKYSLMFSLTAAPKAQRAMMMRQMNAQMDQLNELRAATLTTDLTDRRDIIRRQVQNLFRFFRLYRRKGEFNNPFTGVIDLTGLPTLEHLSRPDIVQVICEFYFSHGYYEDGLELARRTGIASEGIPQPDTPEYLLVQRMGFANMKLGRYREALGHFDRILMTSPEKTWVLKNAARCLMRIGDYSKALQHWNTIASLKGNENDAQFALNAATCHLELKEYDQAVRDFFKAEYLGAKPARVLRQLSWALLMNGDPERSRRYLQQAIEKTGAIPNDYLNMGHISLVTGNFSDALDSYRKNIETRTALPEDTTDVAARQKKRRKAVDDFMADMTEDTPSLTSLGVDPAMIRLLGDALLYNME